MPSDKSKRDPDQKLNPARPILSPKFAVVTDGIVDQLLDQLHLGQNVAAELDTELEQEPDRKKAGHPIPQRSLELPKRRATDKKRPARVVEIARSAPTPENREADPKTGMATSNGR